MLEALDGTPETSVPAEIIVGGEHEFYDFAAKYLPEEHTELDVPADLPADTAAELREMAARAFEAIGCEGLARVDFFLMPDGSLVLNEVNTMPGFTPTSMYPADVGRDRDRLSRTGRPADPARPPTLHRPALTRLTRLAQWQGFTSFVYSLTIGASSHHRGRHPVGAVRTGHGHLQDRPVAGRRDHDVGRRVADLGVGHEPAHAVRASGTPTCG